MPRGESRPKAFKPTEDPTTITYLGKILDSKDKQITWIDGYDNTFYLLKINDDGTERTFFAKAHVYAMFVSVLREDDEFQIWTYPRKSNKNKYFDEIAIEIDGNEYKAQDYEREPKIARNTSKDDSQESIEEEPPVRGQKQDEQVVNKTSNQKENKRADIKGLYLESIADAARIFSSERVQDILNIFDHDISFEEIRQTATVLFIEKCKQGLRTPTREGFASENIKVHAKFKKSNPQNQKVERSAEEEVEVVDEDFEVPHEEEAPEREEDLSDKETPF